MPGNFVSIVEKPVDWEDIYDEVSAAAGAADAPVRTTIVSKKLQYGKRAKIVAYRQAWPTSLNTNVTLRLQVNGNNQRPFESTQVQLAAPEAEVYLPAPIEVPQGATVAVVADNETVAGLVTARLIVYYYDV